MERKCAAHDRSIGWLPADSKKAIDESELVRRFAQVLAEARVGPII